ncbi:MULTISPECIES: hypothetical protein [unclassified Janthinobacterium]|uniref:hypothetical protein n=1 Tax=unclassified Janthinobacterium TaxID=2610881 RepID=UPI00034829A9|nr:MULTISPECIES: hypothetical protein [unclassified Janthinobacterium]MEC5160815.1 hypothetical protein [Janthinobacterium sp. CG_S6]
MRLSYAVVMVATLYAGCAVAERPAQTSAPVAPVGQPLPPKPIPDQEPEVTQAVRQVLLDAAEGKVAPQQFTERARAAMFPDEAKALGASLRGYGALDSLQLLERKVDGEDRLYRYRAAYAKASVLVDITYNKGGRIGLLQARPE